MGLMDKHRGGSIHVALFQARHGGACRRRWVDGDAHARSEGSRIQLSATFFAPWCMAHAFNPRGQRRARWTPFCGTLRSDSPQGTR